MYKQFHGSLTAFAKAFNIEIQTLTKEWRCIYESRLTSRGKADAVKFMKELNTAAERYALWQDIEPIPWTKSSSDGYPKVLNKFKPYLRSENTIEVVMALSVMRSVECLRLPISKDISTVIEPTSGINQQILDGLTNFIPYWIKGLKPIIYDDIKYHVTVKNGPNGHALRESDKDVWAIMQDEQLYNSIRIVERCLGDENPMRLTEGRYPNVIHSKLTQFPEKSGKTRTIAVVDYYSQRCLRTLHEGLTDMLSRMVSDGTFSHMNVGKYAQRKTKEKSYIFCADLTAATDRFPKQLLKALLYAVVEVDYLAAAYWNLLAERQFTVAWSGEQVQYACGQPMGCYASWPLFALGHHMVVEYAAYCAGIKPRKAANLYRLIGDDVIITHELTAQYYYRLMTGLGLTVNKSKTVESLPNEPYVCAEVAKQLYLNGNCLTPLTPGFIKDLKKPYMFNTCIEVLRSRYEFIRPESPPMLIEHLYPKVRYAKLVWILATNPIDGSIKPGNPGYDRHPWGDITETEVRGAFFDLKFCSAYEANMDALFALNVNSFRQLRDQGYSWESNTQIRPQAVDQVVTQLEKQLNIDASDKFRISSDIYDLKKYLGRFAYTPDPKLPFKTRREMRCKHHSNALVKVYRELMSSKNIS